MLLGCNDFSTPPQPSYPVFAAAYNALLDDIEAVYGADDPLALPLRIVVATGPYDVCNYQDFPARVMHARNDTKVRHAPPPSHHKIHKWFETLGLFFHDCFPLALRRGSNLAAVDGTAGDGGVACVLSLP